MLLLTVNDIKQSEPLKKEIRWDITPEIFLNPSKRPDGMSYDVTHGYMFYVDLMEGQPVIMIMQLRRIMSKTVGYITDIPEDMLKESMNCTDKECIAGMYPISERLEVWLKESIGLA